MNISPSYSLHPIPIQSKNRFCTFAHLHICTILIQCTFRCKTMLSITISHRINYYRHFSPDFLFDFEENSYLCRRNKNKYAYDTRGKSKG